jgi:hypothetical protein
MNARAAYPLPEVVDQTRRKKWVIEATGTISPRVELTHGMLIVPLDESAQSRFMRDHELGHVHWSPKRPDAQALKHKVSPDVLAAVEDLRINTKLSVAGVDTSTGGWSKGVCEALAKDLLRRNDPRLTVLMAVAAQGSGLMEKVFNEVLKENAIGTSALEIARMARNALWDVRVPKFRDTVRVAKWLQTLLDAGCALDPRFPGISGKHGCTGLEAALKIAKGCGTSKSATRRIPWGKMKIETPPRAHRVAGYLGRRNRATDEGTYPRFAHRLLVDGRIFKHYRRGRGGSALIDASGSMSLASEDIQKILDAAPGCTVAVYSGNVRDGVLRVLAKEGREVEPNWIAAPAGGANVVDGPALQWLSKQLKPRVWVSDGQVTGVNDRSSAVNQLECLCLTRQHQIVRRDKVEDAVLSLSRLVRHCG